MNIIKNYLKTLTPPIWLGNTLSYIPYDFRPVFRKKYHKQQNAIKSYSEFNIAQKKEFIFKHFFEVFKHAYINVPFYTDLYKSHGIEIGDLKDFNSIKALPIIKKTDLIGVPLSERSYKVKNRKLVNTGGSSGKTLSFYINPEGYGNEWAHIHKIWAKLGYKPHMLKLQFGGRSTIDDLVQYNYILNSLSLDIYANLFDVCKKINNITKKHKIFFLHGYPSAIYEFAIHCHSFESELVATLRNTLKGVFLASEYPSPIYREKIEDVFGVKTQSFYGHTEACVMAYEQDRYIYKTFQTYGYAEAIEDSETTDLVGTNYFNFSSPLIRYNTEDSIEIIKSDDGLMDLFKIKEGRKGEFILDSKKKKIALTGLVFGRHHKIFELCKHIQIKQESPGKAVIFYVSENDININDDLFDFKNIDIEFEFKRIDNPIKTKSGKVNILIK